MSLFIKTRRQQKRSTRTWFGCDNCSMHGDYTIGGGEEEAEAFLRTLAGSHRCPSRSPAEAQQ